jgi:2-polyprenyl-3-methyl-5-hydroxy-6-metoxy-1,4-benzoquinol methylase
VPQSQSTKHERASGLERVRLQRTLYDSQNPTRRWLHTVRRDWIEDRLRALSRTAGARRALEVGPGSGVYLPVLSDLFQEVVATDVDPQYLAHLPEDIKGRSNLRLVEDDITETGLAAGSFDLILCSEVIEHVTRVSRALRSMHRLLKPGGVLLLSTPQRYSPLEVLGRIAYRPPLVGLLRRIYGEPILDPHHISLLSEREARDHLQASGFRILEAHKSGVYVPLLAELGGQTALRVEQALESYLRGSRFDWLLWTQYYVAVA